MKYLEFGWMVLLFLATLWCLRKIRREAYQRGFIDANQQTWRILRGPGTTWSMEFNAIMTPENAEDLKCAGQFLNDFQDYRRMRRNHESECERQKPVFLEGESEESYVS